MSYEPNTWVSGDIVTAAKLNNIETGIQEAAQQGGGYDLVIESGAFLDFDNMTASDFTITSGSILDCEDKADAGEPVNGVCIVHSDWSYTPSSANTNKDILYIPLTRLDCPYTLLEFGQVTCTNNGENYCPMFRGLSFLYDPSDGSLVGAHGTCAELTVS